MEIANLEQPPFAATLMGCLKGASDYFGLDSSPAMLYGLTGHAFLINMHAELEPSSPYVWMKSRFIQLLEGCGIRFTTHYDMLTNDTPESERAAVERELKSAMEAGKLCMVNFLEHQLVAGFDGDGFIMLQPWNGTAFSEIKSLSFGTWVQCLKEAGWVSFTVLARSERRTPIRQAARDAIAYAYELFYHPVAYQAPGYRIGEGAYDNWISGVKRGLGTGHGHWWNAQVWSESRSRGSAFFGELAESAPGAEQECAALSHAFAAISEMIAKAGDRELPANQQIELLTEAKRSEAAAISAMQKLAASSLAG